MIQLIDSNQLHDLPSLNRTVSKFALLDSRVRPAIGSAPITSAPSIYAALNLGITKRMGSRLQLTARYALASSASYAMFYADANSGIPNEWK